MDEPTEGIQPNIIQQIGRVIRQLRDQGEMAIILVEQYFDFAYDLADRFYVLSRGRDRQGRGAAGLRPQQLRGAAQRNASRARHRRDPPAPGTPSPRGKSHYRIVPRRGRV
jgi:ABC-type multidrug transport system ATPase subunit